ncbi:MAG: PP2C family protein-serine/threonine phosphatase [Candidatus Sulfotelmatobacter sp.]
MDGTTVTDAALATLRGDVIDIVLGTVFLTVGATACAVAAIRWRRGVGILVWWGIFSGMYGLQTLGQTHTILTVLPHSFLSVAPYVKTAVSYLLLVSALFAWRELTLGKLRLLIQLEIIVGLAIALLGIGTFALGGPANQWIFYNNLLAALGTPVLLAVVLVPRFSRFLVIPNHRVLAAGGLIFASEVLYTNLGTVLRYRAVPLLDSLGFVVLLFSLGYVALQIVFTNERRLLAIETELETARQIQSSILPASVPEFANLRIATSYCPMTAVAGDFYHFIRTDDDHLGILVADVSGHGVPAALISSMLKVAMQSVFGFADDPARLLGGLNRILSSEASGQIMSAAYLWIDTRKHSARYSAAGHPPLLCWRSESGQIERIESNGLLFGISPDADYPVRTVSMEPSDRFLLYTDGVTETENPAGEAFGDRRLEQVVRAHPLQPAAELSRQLLAELRKWRSAGADRRDKDRQDPDKDRHDEDQQDDITLIVVDILEPSRQQRELPHTDQAPDLGREIATIH